MKTQLGRGHDDNDKLAVGGGATQRSMWHTLTLPLAIIRALALNLMLIVIVFLPSNLVLQPALKLAPTRSQAQILALPRK
jgi:hypothetical protein